MKAAIEWATHKIHKREVLAESWSFMLYRIVFSCSLHSIGCTIRRPILVSEHIRSFFVSIEPSASSLVVGPIHTTLMATLQQTRNDIDQEVDSELNGRRQPRAAGTSSRHCAYPKHWCNNCVIHDGFSVVQFCIRFNFINKPLQYLSHPCDNVCYSLMG